MLHGMNLLGQALHRVARVDRNLLLSQDPTRIDPGIHQVNSAPRHLLARFERPLHGMNPGIGRKERRMKIEDTIRKSGKKWISDNPHESGQDDPIDFRRLEAVGQLLDRRISESSFSIRSGIEDERGNSCGFCDLEDPGFGYIGQDHGDLDIKRTRIHRLQDRCRIAPLPRTENGNLWLSGSRLLFCNSFHRLTRRLSRHQRENPNLNSETVEQFLFLIDEGIRSVVSALRVDMGADFLDHTGRPFLAENDYMIDKAEGTEDLGTIGFTIHGAVGPLQFSHRFVAVDRDHQSVAQGRRFPKIPDMTDMEHIESSIGQNELPSTRLQLFSQFADLLDAADHSFRHGLSTTPQFPLFTNPFSTETTAMHDPRIDQLARQLVRYSTATKRGENVLIELFDVPEEMGIALIREVRAVKATPFINIHNAKISREMGRAATEEQYSTIAKHAMHQMKNMDCYIAIRGSHNVNELSDVPAKKMQMLSTKMRPVLNERVNKTRWCVLRWPNPSMAQSAGMSTEAFEDFYFRVCLLEYNKLKRGMNALGKLMTEANDVHIMGPGTDLRFSVKGLPGIPCGGTHNIPDGECFTAPVKDSVEGVISYNAPSIYQGIAFDNVKLEFDKGKIVKATANNTKAINKIFDTDPGARYIGEFAIGFNPEIKEPMRDILFDEKIAGSFHFTPGQAYEVADNGNRSSVHWDLVNIQRPDYGGGEIYFDGKLIRKNGQFVPKSLHSLNY